MLESVIRTEMYHTLAVLGFNPYHPMDAGRTFESRPDLFGLNTAGETVVVEVKRVLPLKMHVATFDPRDISSGQRRWLDWWSYGRCGQGYIAIGTTWHTRRLWLIPWREWVKEELQWLETFKDIPKYKPSIAIFDAVFEQYECEKLMGKVFSNDKTEKFYWSPTPEHPIRKIPTRLHMPGDWTLHAKQYGEYTGE